MIPEKKINMFFKGLLGEKEKFEYEIPFPLDSLSIVLH